RPTEPTRSSNRPRRLEVEGDLPSAPSPPPPLSLPVPVPTPRESFSLDRAPKSAPNRQTNQAGSRPRQSSAPRSQTELRIPHTAAAMGDAACDDAVEQLAGLLDKVDAPLKKTFENVHQGYPTETLVRFLKAREWHVNKAQKMLVESLNWRIQNEIDNILEKPIIPVDLYRSIRDTQLVGLSGYSKEVVKPLLQERTRKKVHVLRGCGKDELLKIMDYSSLPHFCRREGSGASKHSSSDPDDCFSLDHPFHQELYNFIQEQALNMELIKQGSMHVNIPEQDPEDAKIVGVIEAEFHKLSVQNGSTNGADKE
ncbi:unnamed protein product, partial [Urochloa humidicola]